RFPSRRGRYPWRRRWRTRRNTSPKRPKRWYGCGARAIGSTDERRRMQQRDTDLSNPMKGIAFQDPAAAERRLSALLDPDRPAMGENLRAALEEAAEPDRVLVSLERFFESAAVAS